MYRIEVKPGEEAVFRTIEELATGIRNGFVTPRARIYHAASQKWLPIEFHPHYKRALEGTFTPTPPTPQPSLAEMPAPTFAFPAAAPAPASSSAAPNPPASTTEPAPVRTAPSPVRAPSPPPAKAPPTATAAAESPVLAMRAAVRYTHADVGEAEAEGLVERYSPVAVLEAPRPARAVEMPQPAPAVEMPRPAPAPEVVLPNIIYPEVPPMESEHRAPARRSRRAAGRPLLLIGSAAALVLGGQRYLAARSAAGSAHRSRRPLPRRRSRRPARSSRRRRPPPRLRANRPPWQRRRPRLSGSSLLRWCPPRPSGCSRDRRSPPRCRPAGLRAHPRLRHPLRASRRRLPPCYPARGHLPTAPSRRRRVPSSSTCRPSFPASPSRPR